jgi:hypothetical protein
MNKFNDIDRRVLITDPLNIRQIYDPINVHSITNPIVVSGIETPIDINQNTDAFGRLRVSLPSTQYEYNFQYNDAPLIWQSKLGGLGTATHIPTQSTVRLNTGEFPTANQYKLVGYGDASNGIFVGIDDTGIFLLLRSSATGAVSDSRKIYKANWNMDTYDDMDIDKTQIFVIDISWLGVSIVRCGFQFSNSASITWCHTFYNANILNKVYMTSANLPLRYEINDGDNYVIRQTYAFFRYRPAKSLNIYMTFNMYDNDVSILDQICASVINETSGDAEAYYQSSVGLGVVPRSVTTTYIPIISIRPKLEFNGIVNRGTIICEDVEITLLGA